MHASSVNDFKNLEKVEKMKDLGVIVDEKLKFYDHIHERVNKAYSMLGIIKKKLQIYGQSSISVFVQRIST